MDLKTLDASTFIVSGFPERRPFALEQVAKWGLHSEQIKWIQPPDDRAITRLNYRPSRYWIDPYQNRFLRQGELRCAIGHYLAWKAIANAPHDWGLILEDDVKTEELLPSLSLSEVDLLYLAYKPISGFEAPKAKGPLVPAPYTYWTTAYLLRKSAAQKLAKAFQPQSIIPSDEFLPYHYGKNPHVGEELHRQSPPCHLKAFLLPSPVATQSGKWESGTEQSPSSFQFLTLLYGTNYEMARPALEAYAELGYGPIRIGTGEADWDTNRMGGMPKIRAYRDWIRSHLHQREACRTILLLADAYDTLPVRSGNETMKRLAEVGKPILVGGETVCWPKPEELKDKFPAPTKERPYPYPNSGLILGHATDLYHLLERMELADPLDDQLALQRIIVQEQESSKKEKQLSIGIDPEGYVFQNLSNTGKDIGRKQGFPFNSRTRCYPAIIHANGPDKDLSRCHPQDWSLPELHPSAFRFIEVAPGILKMPFLNKESVANLLQLNQEENQGWKPLPGDNVPGDELRLKEVDLMWGDWFETILKERLSPIINQRWLPATWGTLKDLFLIRYSPDKQPYIRLHNDHSYFSCSIKLKAASCGGWLHFPRQNYNDALVENGELLVWPAQITHPHQVAPVGKGQRVSLIVWTNQ